MSNTFKAEVKKYDPDDEAGESFTTRAEAEEWLISQQAYGYHAMWLNGKRVRVWNGRVIENEPVSSSLARAGADFGRIFRPQPTRGSGPTNPATLEAKGKL